MVNNQKKSAQAYSISNRNYERRLTLNPNLHKEGKLHSITLDEIAEKIFKVLKTFGTVELVSNI